MSGRCGALDPPIGKNALSRVPLGLRQLRDAVCDFANGSRHANPWAADVYERARARKHDHPHAVRILARAWLSVIWHCWQTNTSYDPAKHGALQALQNHS